MTDTMTDEQLDALYNICQPDPKLKGHTKFSVIQQLIRIIRQLRKENERLQKVVESIRKIHSPGTTPGCSICDALSGLDEKED